MIPDERCAATPGHTDAVPIADDQEPHPSEEPGQGPEPGPEQEPTTPDPFDGLVLDEDFIRSASVKEPAARTRMLSARWHHEPPVDPGGRRWSTGPAGKARARGRKERSRPWYLLLAVLAVLLSLVTIAVGPSQGLLSAFGSGSRTPSQGSPGSPRPSTDAALPGGGVSDGGECGVKGFHHFPLPAAPASAPTSAPGTTGVAPVALAEPVGSPPSGPQLMLGSYGFGASSAHDPGRFTIDLLLAPGDGLQPLDLSQPLGPEGVAVEIEGPDGLVAGAHGLPVTLDAGTPRTASGAIHIGAAHGGSARVTLPAQALCPGINGYAVLQRLSPPVDSHNTITGQPSCTLTVSISDPAIGAVRRATGSAVQGDVLSADNRLPQ